MSTLRERFGEHPVAITALLVLGLGLPPAIVGVQIATSLIFTLGFFVVVPLVYLLYGGDDDETEAASSDATAVEDDPVEELRRRYAAGELSDAEFERKLDRLLETEGLEAGDRRDAAGTREGGAQRRDRDLERELE